jgi:hypothetical protein
VIREQQFGSRPEVHAQFVHMLRCLLDKLNLQLTEPFTP